MSGKNYRIRHPDMEEVLIQTGMYIERYNINRPCLVLGREHKWGFWPFGDWYCVISWEAD